MVRSLWTAATGMIAQQNNVDTIANNLSNVNTMGYKTQQMEFKSLLYQTLQTRTTSANGAYKPSSAQVGLGVRNASITTIYTNGSFLANESPTAFAISGKGFFAVRGEDGDTYYTRNGNFQWSLAGQDSYMLADSNGWPVLDTNGAPILLDGNTYDVTQVVVVSDGTVCYPDENNNPQSLGITIGLYQFNNPGGLEKKDSTLYAQTAASGAPINEATSTTVEKSVIRQGYLEGSNVQIVDEMVNMIVAQRAYEMNSKAIIASDEMLQQANNLRR